MATIGIATIDTSALLDTSRVGAEAAKHLEKVWNEAKSQPEDKRRELMNELEGKRASLREQLIDRARPIVDELAKKKGLSIVVERGVVAFSAVEDLTSEVIAKVDALGPLKT